MRANRLPLNPSKTEVLWCSSQTPSISDPRWACPHRKQCNLTSHVGPWPRRPNLDSSSRQRGQNTMSSVPYSRKSSGWAFSREFHSGYVFWCTTAFTALRGLTSPTTYTVPQMSVFVVIFALPTPCRWSSRRLAVQQLANVPFRWLQPELTMNSQLRSKPRRRCSHSEKKLKTFLFESCYNSQKRMKLWLC